VAWLTSLWEAVWHWLSTAIFAPIWQEIYKTVIEAGRWRFYVQGIGNTLLMAAVACLIGVAIGLLIAVVKVVHASSGEKPKGWLRILNWFANFYTTIIRGTPMVLQLLIIFFIVFAAAPFHMAIYVAALAFGLNSGAYVSEIIRAGILSIDRGQVEAGRSLGLSSAQTMRLIVLPQAVKNILPALFNEFISLLKETSVAGWISVVDVTKAGDLIRTRVPNFSPLLVSAAIYLAMVLGLTRLLKGIERRLSQSDRR